MRRKARKMRLPSANSILDSLTGCCWKGADRSLPARTRALSAGGHTRAPREREVGHTRKSDCGSSAARARVRAPMDTVATPTQRAEYLCVDTETNGRAGDDCELTEVGAVLVGGGELHERFESLVRVERPLSRGIERFTGITQGMVAGAPPPELVLPRLARMLDGRVLVAHSASFDRRVLAQAFERAGINWPDPPTLCTVALARRFSPLARQRKLAPLAESL